MPRALLLANGLLGRKSGVSFTVHMYGIVLLVVLSCLLEEFVDASLLQSDLFKS